MVLVAKPYSTSPHPTTQETVCSIVMSKAATQTAVANAIAQAASKNLDGVNVDFEGSSSPGCSATADFANIQDGFTNFMSQMTAQAHQHASSWEVSVDTYSGSASWEGGIFSILRLGSIVDAIYIMDYDMYGNLPGQAAPNAPVNGWSYDDQLSVSQYVSKAPASKVLLGVPYYGYKWSTLSGPNNSRPGPYATATSTQSADTYGDILSEFACAQQLQGFWDYTAQSPWASWWSPAANDPCGGNHNSWRELYYDDAASLGIKYDLVNSYGLRGGGPWALGYDSNPDLSTPNSAPELWAVLASKFGTAWPGPYHAITPSRLLDTRSSLGGHVGPLAPGEVFDLTATGGAIPAGAAAAVLNVTLVQPSRATYLTIYPSGSGRPGASNVNASAGRIVNNLVEVGLGTGGKATIFNAVGSADVVIDAFGWYSPAPAGGSAGRVTPVAPARLFDSRGPSSGGPLTPGATRDLQVTGRDGIPAGAQAVVVNIAVTNGTAPSYVTAYAPAPNPPPTSNLNFVAGQTVSDRAYVPLDANGLMRLRNAVGSVDVIVDVSGWVSGAAASPAGGLYTAVSPVRIVDSRLGLGTGSVSAGQTVGVQVAGIASLPVNTAPTPPAAVVMNVTATGPSAQSYLTLFPSGSGPAPPLAADLNFAAGATVGNLVVVKVGPDGLVDLYNAAGTTNVVMDVLGWYS